MSRESNRRRRHPPRAIFRSPPDPSRQRNQFCQMAISQLPYGMTCPKRTVDPYVHLFLHSQYVPNDQWQRANITTRQILTFSGHHTPDVTAHQLWLHFFHPAAHATARAFHRTVAQDRFLQYGIYHQDFGVSRQEWPERLHEAWQLENPPTPYEIATAILKEPKNHFFKLGVRLGAEMQHNRSMFHWWLLGMREEAIAVVLRTDRPRRGKQKKDKKGRYLPQPIITAKEETELMDAMVLYIRYLMSVPKFALWAIGTNILPACTDRKMAAVAAAIMKGESYGAEAGKTLERSAKKLMHHPYITSQIRSGRALNPVPRTIYSPGIIWKDHSEKETWEREGSKGSQTIQQSRTTLLKQAKAHPLWLQLPLYDT